MSRMEPLVVVTHATPVHLRARPLESNEQLPPETVALAFLVGDHVIARGVVAEPALPTINALLATPVTVALAATEDDDGNIEARVCIVVRVSRQEDEVPEEPWRESIPAPPFEAEESENRPGEDGLALVPLGNVVRASGNRHHEDLAGDAREMLTNLLTGRSQDAVRKAIDDLLDSL
ncbi:MAG: hypothetical protein ACREL7_18500 [Longimicrobiales bacterium]